VPNSLAIAAVQVSPRWGFIMDPNRSPGG
jgi:hypothetical protein